MYHRLLHRLCRINLVRLLRKISENFLSWSFFSCFKIFDSSVYEKCLFDCLPIFRIFNVGLSSRTFINSRITGAGIRFDERLISVRTGDWLRIGKMRRTFSSSSPVKLITFTFEIVCSSFKIFDMFELETYLFYSSIPAPKTIPRFLDVRENEMIHEYSWMSKNLSLWPFQR